jgi:hypothetical protein
MRIHHVIRGGLIITGIGIGAMSLTASAGVGTLDTSAASAVGRVAVAAVVEDVEVQAAPLPAAAATPVVLVAPVADEAEVVPTPEPERPVVQAGPGPATPVEGATTLIDPLVIER